MPKRKGATRFSGVAPGSDDEDVMQINETQEERPAKKVRGRPRSKSTEPKPSAQTKRNSDVPAPPAEPTTKRTTRRGRPKGSRTSVQAAEAQETTNQPGPGTAAAEDAGPQTVENAPTANGQVDDAQEAPKSKKPTRAAKSAGTRGRKKGSTGNQLKTDGEFEYTPSAARQTKSPGKAKEPSEQPEQSEQPKRQQRKTRMQTEADNEAPETENEAPDVPEVVEETMLQEEPVLPRAASASPTKRRQSTQRNLLSSPAKRRSATIGEDDKNGGEPELRRKIGELTRKCDTLESRYRTLKEIGIVEANANMDKLRKQCESMKTASDNVIASLKEELGAQKVLGQQSRTLQKELKERDAEIAQLKSQAEEASSQVTSAQTEAKALKTKLAAARNTAASLENAAIKVPGSAIKGGGANRANAAANAEAAHAAQFAQLKEDLYSDLTGLIIRDVKRRDADNLYDCIQTGINGTLHFKLAVPLDETAASFETAEFQYIPLLDENRDRELVDILPEYLTVDITFVRQQASKFYTRVIDALTKRRNSSTR
ncbi:hypothetical protein P170DRAFT_508763 [Aspergillus steynii IBT 23096]|uniref:Monopolin complex subunit Csm1/Pcs1 C-terminal domain-containing protein n=1 Tax=Aspergillus steynii IBT 23096 TaxID=1392250 RepID=A0A2I2GCJ3_9EURO|nr:uncharacterized protein P170DRAFT_508763 [Aspergillus steynii IBT 23096]PLB50606.1 hypothetical protein P170DRAFT_508763 [Aspergillus steynii IBT 23096]